MATPRGIRNHNWGNIRHGNTWRGEIAGTDAGFESFENPVWGLRALIKTTRSYYYRHGITTVDEWVDRWAPAEDNNPHNEKYKNHICKAIGGEEINPHDVVQMMHFTKAVCQFECGIKAINAVWVDWYFLMAWKLA